VAVNGSLGGFSGGTQGGQSPASWGASTGSQGQSGSSTQSSTQRSSQSANQGGDGGPKQTPNDGTGTPQEPKGEPNLPSDGDPTTQEPKGEPNDGNPSQEPKGEPNDGNPSQEPKGEPNDGNPSQEPKGEPNYPGDGGSSGTGSGSGSGSGSSSSSGGSSSSSSSSSGGGGSGDVLPPLDPGGDSPYDPTKNGDDQQVPTGCAEANSKCAECVRRHEASIQFNRRYLHVAWSTAHNAITQANRAIAVGDTASGMHATQGLAWQLGGKPQIVEALDDLRVHYRQKADIYIGHIEDSMRALAQCEADNFAIRDLYTRFGVLYVEMLKARYGSADP
jgi:hypothetical protein